MVSKPLIWGLGNIHEYCSLMHVFFLQRRCCAWFFCFAFALWLHTCVLFWRLCLHGALEFLVLWLSDMPSMLFWFLVLYLRRLVVSGFDSDYGSVKDFYQILLSCQMVVTYEKIILVSADEFPQFSRYKQLLRFTNSYHYYQ